MVRHGHLGRALRTAFRIVLTSLEGFHASVLTLDTCPNLLLVDDRLLGDEAQLLRLVHLLDVELVGDRSLIAFLGRLWTLVDSILAKLLLLLPGDRRKVRVSFTCDAIVFRRVDVTLKSSAFGLLSMLLI